MKVDLRLIQQQLRSTQWIDKVLHIIRNELPAELVLANDPKTGKMTVPIEFWEGIKDFLVARGVLTEVVKEELTRHRDNKWEEFLVENENRIRNLFLDNNSAQRAELSREEFLYLVATESSAIWTSLEGWVDLLVQRQLDQWKSEAAAQGGDNEQG
ncbi:hypothetical protein BGZ95_009474 [Linnemannia exigua]|uniref:Uncharacterized protein n=1 Tax=Linnemannia exigua TaxID=604196 RepID=A0AAD4DCX3_9FUNG|nr:hypothetical protein BGZ95_009474 [Linnemannia exigua]